MNLAWTRLRGSMIALQIIFGMTGTSISVYQQLVDDYLFKLTEVWHIAHFWMSYGRCAMQGLPIACSE